MLNSARTYGEASVRQQGEAQIYRAVDRYPADANELLKQSDDHNRAPIDTNEASTKLNERNLIF